MTTNELAEIYAYLESHRSIRVERHLEYYLYALDKGLPFQALEASENLRNDLKKIRGSR